MLNGMLNNYTNEQLSRFTNRQLQLLDFLGYIFDRSSRDVERWRELRDKGWDRMTEDERQEWLFETLPIPSASKGMYTHNDLLRVETTVENLAVQLRKLGYDVPEMTIRYDWTYEDVITKEEIDRYFSNIETLRSVRGVFSSTPKTPSTQENFNYSKANNIERILYDISTIVDNQKKSWCYMGEIISGEV